MRERTTASLDAGCDIALHCNGERPEMEAIINACGKMRPETTQRLQYAESFRKAAAPLDLKDAEAKLKQLMKA
jgi:beta-N-acetylhexosaminidase